MNRDLIDKQTLRIYDYCRVLCEQDLSRVHSLDDGVTDKGIVWFGLERVRFFQFFKLQLCRYFLCIPRQASKSLLHRCCVHTYIITHMWVVQFCPIFGKNL